jgi:exosortase/archaeosortase family protein
VLFRSDERLIVQLRDVATMVTSRVLDYFGILHMLSGNVIELPEKKLFVADACSGIHSLFVLLAAAAIVAVWNYRGPLATCVLLLATFGLVMIENVLRLLAVSVSIRVGYDLSEGTGHQVLGFVLFAFSLAMILSIDQWIAFMSVARRAKVRKEPDSKDAKLHYKPFAVIGALTLVFVPIQWMKMPDEVPRLTDGFSADIKIAELGRDFLSTGMNGFRLVDFERVMRVPDDPFGHHSQIWRFSRGNAEVMISLNYAYRGIHDACLCYRNTGWEVQNEQIFGVEDSGIASIVSAPSDDWAVTPALRANLSHPLEGEAVLFYSMLSESGKTGVLVDSRKLGTASRQAAGRFQAIQLEVPEQWVQLQMVALQPGGFSEPELAELEVWFRDVQAMLFRHCKAELSR